jgi:thiosulfate dehydrogenase (quinone) large subunit
MRAETISHEMINPQADRRLAYALLRAIIGVNLAVHGVSRLLAGPHAFAASLVGQFQATPLPAWSVMSFGLVLPWVEAALGLLILFGLATRFALVAASLTILALTFGSTLRQDWQTAALQLIYAAIYAALLSFRSENAYSRGPPARLTHNPHRPILAPKARKAASFMQHLKGPHAQSSLHRCPRRHCRNPGWPYGCGGRR